MADETRSREQSCAMLDLWDERATQEMRRSCVVASRCDRIIRLHDGRIVDETELDTGPESSDMLNRIGRMDAS